MALTRAIDTLYIQINDKNSYIGKLVCEYIEINKNNKNIRWCFKKYDTTLDVPIIDIKES